MESPVVVAFRLRGAAFFAWMALAASFVAALTPTRAADPPSSPDAILDDLSAALAAGRTNALPSLFAASGLRVHLRVPGGREIGDETHPHGSQQAIVLLREYLAAVEMRPFDPGVEARPSPGRQVWIERPAGTEKAKLSPHGIFHLSVRADEDDRFEHQRLYVGLRETPAGWKVGEILHLP